VESGNESLGGHMDSSGISKEKFLKANLFGDRLSRLMAEKNLSPSDLADELDVTPATVYNYLRGETEPCCEKLSFLGMRLGVSQDYLVTGEDRIQHPLPEEGINLLLQQLHSQVHRDNARHQAMVGQVALELAKRISEASEAASRRAVPSPEFIESEYIVETERYSLQTWIASKRLKYDAERECVAVRFLHTMAENLCRGRSYRFLLPRNIEHNGVVGLLKGNLRRLSQTTQAVEQHCDFRYAETFPLVGFGLHQVDRQALEGANGLLMSRIQDWLFHIEARDYSGYWLGHIITPVPRAEYVILMDQEHVAFALRIFAELWSHSHVPLSRISTY
jgi:transcriptional regulator with XRE-family HTH domain